jgi:signal transduction histidine kinase
MQTVSVDFLASIEPLKNVPKEQLQWLIDQSNHYVIPEGEFLFKEDDPVKGTHIIISGFLRIYYMQGKSSRELGVLGPKEITGYLPYSRGRIAEAFGQAFKELQIMTFPIEKGREMINTQYELTAALVHFMLDRTRNYTALQQQNEKMLALGKLSAGLTHELNNPASAIIRSSTLLQSHLRMQPETFKSVIAIRMTDEQVDTVNEAFFAIMKRPKPVLTMMDRADKEDEMTDWLDAHNVKNAMEISENFVDFGFTQEDVSGFTQHIPEAYISPVFNWINNNLVTEKMVGEIQEASQRIADLVSAVKVYTHMDRGQDKQFADIHIGIRNTLTMLNHKLKKANIEVVENYDTELPQVKAMIGELNQVWTNLIDNAIDAMEENGKGRLEIRTQKFGDFVKVYLIDDGPGIPEDIVSQIFDPFFTTKEIGKGTGLGLDVVNRIVQQHNGTIRVSSVPGRTEFIVCFPINGT